MDPMNDDALDRELEQALAVDPSPEFVARVRQRIASEPAPSSSWPWLWRFAAAGAVAAAVVAAVMVTRANRHTVADEKVAVLAGRTFIGIASLQPGASAKTAVAQALRPANTTAARASRPAISDRAPGILIDPREGAALRNLIAGLRDGRIDPASLPADMDTSAPITIPQITIAPVTASSTEGVRQ